MEVDGVLGLLEVPGHVVPPERQERVHVHVKSPLGPLHRQIASNPSKPYSDRSGEELEVLAYGGVEGDAALVLVDAVGGLRDANLVEVGAEEIHGRGPRRATAEAGRV